MTRWKESYQSKLILPDALDETVRSIRERGETIATLNGAFDLLHAGHLHMFYEASLQADRLIVALNSDASIRAYKSENRPIITLENRLQMVGALEFVDFMTYFDETDPISILDTIKPDVHVNGSEYGEDCIESDVVKRGGGRIHIVSRIPGLSTTEIVEKIKTLT